MLTRSRFFELPFLLLLLTSGMFSAHSADKETDPYLSRRQRQPIQQLVQRSNDIPATRERVPKPTVDNGKKLSINQERLLKKGLMEKERAAEQRRNRNAGTKRSEKTPRNSDTTTSRAERRGIAERLKIDTIPDWRKKILRRDTSVSSVNNGSGSDMSGGKNDPATTQNDAFPDWIYAIIGSVFILGLVTGIIIIWRRVVSGPRKTMETLEKVGESRKSPEGDPSGGITLESIALTDAALMSTSQDRLGMAKLVKGLALFFRNTATKPPITMAVTGDWGAGKSSVMRMLKDELDTAEFKSVWFNAWHHQEECHCFGALLENIRRQAIPPAWTLEGLAFRWRLAVIRIRRQFVPVLSSLLLLVTVLLATRIADRTSVFSAYFDSKVFTGGAFAAILWFMFNILRLLSDFGLNLKDSIASLWGGFRVVNIETDPGLRYHLVQALEDITTALGGDRLVLFIDDLDRCPAERIMKVLEVINFLSCAPQRSYIVIGMALERILDCVSGSFAKVANEASGLREGESSVQREERMRLERRAYARQYLNKMINIEIHVPSADSAEMVKLANCTSGSSGTRTHRTLRQRLASIMDKWLIPAVAGIMLSFALGYGYSYFQSIAGEGKTSLQQSGADTAVVASRVSGEEAQYTDSAAVNGNRQPDEESATESTTEAVTSSPLQVDDVIWAFIALLLILGSIFAVAGFIASLLRRWLRSAHNVEDTPYFVKALTAWSGVITAFDPTPRHYIRIINQLRFLSMRARLWGSVSEDSVEPDEKMRIVLFVVLRALMEVSAQPGVLLSILNQIQGTDGSIGTEISDRIRHCLKSTDDTNAVRVITLLQMAWATHSEMQLPVVHDGEHPDAVLFNQLMAGVTLR